MGSILPRKQRTTCVTDGMPALISAPQWSDRRSAVLAGHHNRGVWLSAESRDVDG
jgi:hypothetical protein